MSYTFSRRDFMKYSALTAVAVAGSSMFTGCSSGNPNQPSGKPGQTLTFGGSTGGFLGIGATHDSYLLKNDVSFTAPDTLVCNFEIIPVAEGSNSTAEYYQIVYSKGNVVKGINYNSDGVNFTAEGGLSGLPVNKKNEVKLTITGLPMETLAAADYVGIRYYPRKTALGSTNDAYSDVYATWDITSVIKAAQ